MTETSIVSRPSPDRRLSGSLNLEASDRDRIWLGAPEAWTRKWPEASFEAAGSRPQLRASSRAGLWRSVEAAWNGRARSPRRPHERAELATAATGGHSGVGEQPRGWPPDRSDAAWREPQDLGPRSPDPDAHHRDRPDHVAQAPSGPAPRGLTRQRRSRQRRTWYRITL